MARARHDTPSPALAGPLGGSELPDVAGSDPHKDESVERRGVSALPPTVEVGPPDAEGFCDVTIVTGESTLRDRLHPGDPEEVSHFASHVAKALGDQAAITTKNHLLMVGAQHAIGAAEAVTTRWLSRRCLEVGLKRALCTFHVWPEADLDEQLKELGGWLATRGVGPVGVGIVRDGIQEGCRGPTSARAGLPRPLRLHAIRSLAIQSPWIVRGILERGTVALLYGPPSSFKTFVAIDLGVRLAVGRAVWNHDTRQSAVAFFSGEGQRAVARRVLAATIPSPDKAALERNFLLIPEVLDLTDDVSVAEATSILRGVRPGLAIIDTFSIASPGIDENAAGEVAEALGRCRRLAVDLDCCVLLVHHTTKDGKSERGSSVFRANVDAAYRVVGDKPNLRVTVCCDKNRDEEPAPVTLQLVRQEVDLGQAEGIAHHHTSLRVGELCTDGDRVHLEFTNLSRALLTRHRPVGLKSPSFTEAGVAIVLYEQGDVTQKQLIAAVTERTGRDKEGSIRNDITALRRKGWVEPGMDAGTKRGAQFRLTAAATSVVEKLLEEFTGEKR